MERSREGAFTGFLVGLVAGIVIVFMIFVNPRPFAQLLIEFTQDEHGALIIMFYSLFVIPVVLPILGAIIGFFLGKKNL